MSRYAISGSTVSTIEPTTGSKRNILGKAITSGRVFWLRNIWYGSSGTDGDLRLYDASAAATVTTPVAVLPSYLAGVHSGLARPGYFEWGPPGLKFSTGCVADLAVSGSIAAGAVGGAGYEE